MPLGINMSKFCNTITCKISIHYTLKQEIKTGTFPEMSKLLIKKVVEFNKDPWQQLIRNVIDSFEADVHVMDNS